MVVGEVINCLHLVADELRARFGADCVVHGLMCGPGGHLPVCQHIEICAWLCRAKPYQSLFRPAVGCWILCMEQARHSSIDVAFSWLLRECCLQVGVQGGLQSGALL